MMNFSICVSGAAGGRTVKSGRADAELLGRTIAKSGHTLTTGATVGLPYYAAQAAKQAGGMSIGFSPASSLREHLHKYRLPIGVFDFVNFTGMHYVGRDIHLVQSSDAIITIGGRFGSLHEFTTALLSNMPCGVLTDSGGTAAVVEQLVEQLEAPNRDMLVFDDDPERLVAKVIKMLEKDYADIDLKDELARWYLDSDAPHYG
ncbi:MAG: hypothetical protein QG553_361 [Patescibacteria group bacterium]|nr:hypothetical protein [Patescibacteria group bacterium]